MVLITWKDVVEKNMTRGKKIMERPLNDYEKALFTNYARMVHQSRRKSAGRITGAATGLGTGTVAFAAGLPLVAGIFLGAAGYVCGRLAGRRVHDWIKEAPPPMPTIDETIAFIRFAHAGQVDKAGRDYYHHPVAVMKRLPETTDVEVKLAALLHDVLEDTKHSRATLASMGYTKRTLDAVELLTQKPGDERTYEKKIAALIATGNKDAIRVKFADILENTDPERLAALPPDTRKYLESKYANPKRALALALG